MKRYAIADQFSEPARRAAARALYLPAKDALDLPRTVEGFCPIGVMLLADGIRADASPEPETVVRVMKSLALEEVEIFINDWDNDILSPNELYEALGVERGQP